MPSVGSWEPNSGPLLEQCCSSTPVVPSLWITTPLCLNDPFTEVIWNHPKTQISTLRFKTVAKLQLWSSNENDLMVGVDTTGRTALKGHSAGEVESHCFTPPAEPLPTSGLLQGLFFLSGMFFPIFPHNWSSLSFKALSKCHWHGSLI